MVSFSYAMDTFDIFSYFLHVANVLDNGRVAAKHDEKTAGFRENKTLVPEIHQQMNQSVDRILFLINGTGQGWILRK